MAPFILLLLILSLHINSSTYICAPNEPCAVNCSSINCVSDGIFTVINALDASSLSVYCHEPYICSRLAIDCPITSNPSSCTLQCEGSNSCDSIQIKTHNSTNVNLLCGVNGPSEDIICHNMFIYGMYALEMDIPPKTQNISIECSEAIHAHSPSCDLIYVGGLGEINGSIPNTIVTLNIHCIACNNFQFLSGNEKYINLQIDGTLTHSTFDFSTPSLSDLIMNVSPNGTLSNVTIHALNVQNKFEIYSLSQIGFINTSLYGPYNASLAIIKITNIFPTLFADFVVDGNFHIVGNGQFINSEFHSDSIGFVDLNVSKTSHSSISFYGSIFGQIHAQNSASLSVICEAAHPSESCDGLVIAAPQNGQDSSLQCITHGCTNVTIISVNNFNEMSVSAKDCDCERDLMEATCIGVINLQCAEYEAVFNGSVAVCDGNMECCGSILNDTMDGRCQYDEDTKSIMRAAEVVAIIFGILFGFVVIVLMYYCYCSKQQLVVQSKNLQNPMVDVNDGYGTVMSKNSSHERMKRGIQERL